MAEPGSIIGGRYSVEATIGQGGMGLVVRAKHLDFSRHVAIKLLNEPVETPTAEARGRSRRRLLREAQAAQALRSENVIFVYDVGVDGERPYIVMELLEGQNLSELLAERGKLPVAEAVDYVLQACNGLAEAHAAGVIHRDVKPSNLFMTRRASGEPLIKLLDFGISKAHFQDDLKGDATVQTAILGSPHFMSPEQLRDPSKVDARSDVWSLAVTLFTLIVGRRPFEGKSLTEVSAAIAADPCPSPGPLVPEALHEVIERALAKRPEQRTRSMTAFARELAPFASPASHALSLRFDRAEDDSDSVAAFSESSALARPVAAKSEAELTVTVTASNDEGPAAMRRKRLGAAVGLLLVLLVALGIYAVAVHRPASVAVNALPSLSLPSAPPPAITPAPIPAPAPSPSVAPPAARAKVVPVSVKSASPAPSASVKPARALDIDGIPIPD
jgi:serine/threonine protein kinase